jgi:ABC-type Fe3+-siderophore transport system permease subunit
MLIEDIKNISSTKKDLKEFGITIGSALIVIAGLLFFYSKHSYFYLFIAGLTLVALGLLLSIILKPIQKTWMTISLILGWVSTRVILSILFYIVLTSIALIAKLFGKDFLGLKLNQSQITYWNYREQKPYNKTDSERQF